MLNSLMKPTASSSNQHLRYSADRFILYIRRKDFFYSRAVMGYQRHFRVIGGGGQRELFSW